MFILAGAVLIVLGAFAGPLVASLGWLLSAMAFFAWVAQVDGLALPLPGRLAIRTSGCWEVPFAFTVRYRSSVFLFTREDAADGGWSEEYAVRQRSAENDADPRWALPVGEGDGWSLRGRVPVGLLGFEHWERVCYVRRRSLERALVVAGA